MEENMNIMSLTTLMKCNLGPLSPSQTKIVMSDRSVKEVVVTLQNILVTVRHVTLPVDFVVVNLGSDEEVPIILGRPFLTTG